MKVTLPRAVIEQALDALASAEDQLPKPYSTSVKNAITALRTALERQYMTNAAGELEPVTVVQTGVGIGKPEQEPVAWIDYIVKEAHEKYDLATSRAAFQAGAIFVQRILNTSPEFMDCVITKRTNK